MQEPSLGPEFLSCEFIEGGVMFERDRLMVCCISVPNGKGRVELCEYNGGPIPAKKIEDRRQELRVWNNHSISRSPCEGCHKLTRQAWKNSHLISQITVSHYTICNLRCTYCYVSEYTPEERRVLSVGSYDLGPVIEDMFDRGLVAPKSTACWGGGEPLMFKEFERVAAQFVDHGVFMNLLTNCTIGSEAVKAGLKSGTVAVWCSVDAGTPDTYLRVKGRRRFDTVWKVLSDYSKLNQYLVTAKYIFKDDNCSTAEIDGFLAEAKKAGVKQISISQDMNEYNGPRSATIAQLPQHLVASMAEMAFKALSSELMVSFADSVFSAVDQTRIRLRLFQLALGERISDVQYDIGEHFLLDSKPERRGSEILAAVQQVLAQTEQDRKEAELARRQTEELNIKLSKQAEELNIKLSKQADEFNIKLRKQADDRIGVLKKALKAALARTLKAALARTWIRALGHSLVYSSLCPMSVRNGLIQAAVRAGL